MSRTKGTFSLTSNIEPKFGAPLDARTIVKLLADLTASNTFEYPYKGMKVFVEENNKSYTLVGSDPTVSTNWIEDNGGGHTIKNPAGTAMTQRSNLQFVDLTISDDSTNDATKVESVHVIHSESELANLPDGLYMLDDDEDTVIDGNLVGYDNTTSGLNAENVQDAIDEVVETLDDKIDISVKGTANGVAELDENGKVPSAQLPSYVDDVLEYSSISAFPATGETGKIYVALDTNKTYRWGGTEYVEISESLALGETSSTAYRGDRGKIAYDHSQITSGNPHNVSKSEVGLGNVDNTSDSTKKTNFTGSLAAGDSGFVQGGTIYVALNKKADTVTNATNGNLAGLNGSGNPTDSGWNGAKDTTSISGNPISISGLKSNQLAVNPIITLEPIQAGSGTPSPSNIRAISGYDKVEVLSCGKNILEGTILNASVNGSGVIMRAVNNFSLHYARVGAGKTYTLTSNELFVGGFYLTKPSMGSVSYNGQRVADEPRTFTSPIDGYVVFRTAYSYTTPQLEEGSTSTTYKAPVQTTSISESLGQTVYGGTLDVRTGKLISNMIFVNLKGRTAATYNVDGIYISNVLNHTGQRIRGICSHAFIRTTESSLESGQVQLGAGNATIYWQHILTIMGKTLDEFNTWLATEDVWICYDAGVENYTEIQLTPHEISLLKDYAYVSTNGTSIALDYHNGELASLADVSQLGETVNELGDKVSNMEATVNTIVSNKVRAMAIGGTAVKYPLKQGMIICYGRGAMSKKGMAIIDQTNTVTEIVPLDGCTITVSTTDNTVSLNASTAGQFTIIYPY